jgi:hypothetical protein
MNDMVSERGKVFNKYVVSSSPYILFKCVRAGYAEIEDSGHDISFTLTNGVYTLGELFGEIGILRNFPTPRIPALTPRLGVYDIPSLKSGSTPYLGRTYTGSSTTRILRLANQIYFSGAPVFFKFETTSTAATTTGIADPYTCEIERAGTD